MYNLTEFKNGLSLFTAPVSGTRTATILVIVGTGSKYENKANNGISHFLEHLFFKGTKKRPNAMALSAEMDATGGDYNAFTGKEYTGFYMKVDATKLDQAIDLVSDMLVNSKFDAVEIEKEKGVIVEEINMYEDNPMMHIDDVFEQCLYGDTAAGWDTAGTKEIVTKLTRADFIKYFSAQYKPENSMVCLAGNFKPAAIKKIELAFKSFGTEATSQKFSEKLPVVISQARPALKINYKKTDQAHLSLGVPAYAYGHKDELALKLLAIILGGSMSSRLFSELREKRGLAYYVRTSVESYSDSGYLSTLAGVRVDKLEEAIKVILVEYKKICVEKVTEVELKRVKDLIKGKMVIQLESSDDVADWYARQAIMNLTQGRTDQQGRAKIYTPEEFFKKISKITVEDIQRVAKDIFVTEKLNLAVIGPFKEGEKNFKGLLKL